MLFSSGYNARISARENFLMKTESLSIEYRQGLGKHIIYQTLRIQQNNSNIIFPQVSSRKKNQWVVGLLHELLSWYHRGRNTNCHRVISIRWPVQLKMDQNYVLVNNFRSMIKLLPHVGISCALCDNFNLCCLHRHPLHHLQI